MNNSELLLLNLELKYFLCLHVWYSSRCLHLYVCELIPQYLLSLKIIKSFINFRKTKPLKYAHIIPLTLTKGPKHGYTKTFVVLSLSLLLVFIIIIIIIIIYLFIYLFGGGGLLPLTFSEVLASP